MFKAEFKELKEIIPAGIYEAAISGVEDDGTKIVIGLEIRKDLQQPCAGRSFSQWMYKLHEPKEIDKVVGGYSYNQLMRIGKAAGLPEGKSYGSLSEYLADLAGKAVQVELRYEEWSGKKYLRVRYWNESKAPALTYSPEPRQERFQAGGASQSASQNASQSASQNVSGAPSWLSDELPWG